MYNSYDFIRLYNILNPTSDSDIVMINFNTLIESIKNDEYLFNNINACYINKLKDIIPISENRGMSQNRLCWLYSVLRYIIYN